MFFTTTGINSAIAYNDDQAAELRAQGCVTHEEFEAKNRSIKIFMFFPQPGFYKCTMTTNEVLAADLRENDYKELQIVSELLEDRAILKATTIGFAGSCSTPEYQYPNDEHHIFFKPEYSRDSKGWLQYFPKNMLPAFDGIVETTDLQSGFLGYFGKFIKVE